MPCDLSKELDFSKLKIIHLIQTMHQALMLQRRFKEITRQDSMTYATPVLILKLLCKTSARLGYGGGGSGVVTFIDLMLVCY